MEFYLHRGACSSLLHSDLRMGRLKCAVLEAIPVIESVGLTLADV